MSYQDVLALLADLKTRHLPPERLRELQCSGDPVLVHALFEHLRDRMPDEPELAEFLPRDLDDLAPETQLLAALVYRLVEHSRALPELHSQATAVQVAWLQTHWTRDPDTPAAPGLLQAALETLDWATIRQPETLVRRDPARAEELIRRGWIEGEPPVPPPPVELESMRERALLDPPAHGPAFLVALRDHRRRHPDVPRPLLADLFHLSLQGVDLDPSVLAEILHGRWSDWLAMLPLLPSDDPSWPLQRKVLEAGDRREFLPTAEEVPGPEELDPETLRPQDVARLAPATDPVLLGCLRQVADTPGHVARLAAIRRIGEVGAPEHLEWLSGWLLPSDTRATALEAAGRLGGEPAQAECLMEALGRNATLETQRALFELLASRSHPRLRSFLRAWRKTEDAELRKWVIQATARLRDARDARWLASLTRSADIRDVRWALEALGELGAHWLAVEVANQLENPNMNIKKTAAQVLARAPSVEAVPRLLFWLARHDNPGFRENLLAALRACAEGWEVPALLRESERVEDPRLLREAVSHLLEPPAWVHLIRRGQTWVEDFIPSRQRVEVDRLCRRWGLRPPLTVRSELALGDLVTQVPDTHWLEELSRRLPLLHSAEKVLVVEALRRALQSGAVDGVRVLQVLRQAGAVLGPLEEPLARHLCPDWALESGVPDLDSLLLALRQAPSNRLLERAVRHGWTAEVLLALPHLVERTRRIWRGPVPQAILLKVYASGQEREAVLDWLAEGEGERLDQLFLELLEHDPEHSVRAERYLARRQSRAIEARLVVLLQSSQRRLREAAAGLLAARGPHNRQLVFQAALAGSVPVFLRPDESETRALLEAPVSPQSLKLLGLSLAEPSERLAGLWSLRGRVPEALAEAYQNSLRTFPAGWLLDYLRDDLDAGRWQVLQWLGPLDPFPPEILQRLSQFDEAEVAAWLGLLAERGGLVGAGLAEVLLRLARQPSHQARALQVYAGLREHQRPGSGRGIWNALRSYLPEHLETLVQSLAGLPPAEQVEILGLAEPSAVAARLTQIYLDSPSLLPSYSETARSLVLARVLAMTHERNPEVARRALRLVVQDQPELAAETLEDALHHSQSRVRSLAHRLLQGQVSRQRYLEATVILLGDSQPEFRRRALRVLGFSRYLPAVPSIARLLRDRKKHVDRSARQALLHIGKPALPALHTALSRSRPDHREELRSLIEQIEQHGGPQVGTSVSIAGGTVGGGCFGECAFL